MRLYKRGKIWWCSYYDEHGKRRQVTTHCHDKTAAASVARRLEQEGADPSRVPTTLQGAFELLIKSKMEEAAAGRKSSETVEFYRRKLGHLRRIFNADHFRLSSLKASDVDEYVSIRRSEGVAESTIAKELVALRVSLKLARRRGLWQGDPAEILPIGFAPEYRPRERWLTKAELQLLLGTLNPDRAARVAFIVATSARWGESDRALRKDVSSDARTVHLRGTKTAASLRTVPMVSQEQISLLRYASRHAEGREGFLFVPWKKVVRDLLDACKRVGIERCSPNDLRRTCAMWLRAAGARPDLISPVLGHVDSKMVERVYGRLTPEQLRDQLEEAIGGADCNTGVPDTTDSWDAVGSMGLDNSSESHHSIMGPEGIEPSTLGLKVPSRMWPRPGKTRVKRGLSAATVTPVSQRNRRR